jgi:multidrug resistance efflux pump
MSSRLQEVPPFFTEKALRDAIIATWGPAGAHIDVFDSMSARLRELRAEVVALREERDDTADAMDELCTELEWHQAGAPEMQRLRAANAELRRRDELAQSLLEVVDIVLDHYPSPRLSEAAAAYREASDELTARERWAYGSGPGTLAGNEDL